VVVASRCPQLLFCSHGATLAAQPSIRNKRDTESGLFWTPRENRIDKVDVREHTAKGEGRHGRERERERNVEKEDGGRVRMRMKMRMRRGGSGHEARVTRHESRGTSHEARCMP